MPPRTRIRASKILKENVGVRERNKVKTTQAPRKVLGDKTNSASDDNASVEVPIKKKTVTEVLKEDLENAVRPRRERRLPPRFVENKMLANLSTSKDESVDILKKTELPNVSADVIKHNVFAKDIIIQEASPTSAPQHNSDSSSQSPFKTPSKPETSLIGNRPKRIHRLPSRFEDHSISPHKYIPIQPTNASTPIQVSKKQNEKTKEDSAKKLNVRPVRATKKATLQKKVINNSSENSSPDSNNNPKGKTLRATRKAANIQPSVSNVQENRKKSLRSSVKETTVSPIKVVRSKKNNSSALKDVSSKKVESPKKILPAKSIVSSKKVAPPKKVVSPKKIATPKNIATPKKIASPKTIATPTKVASPKKNIAPPKQSDKNDRSKNNLSFRLLDDKKKSQSNNNADIYEFTFDPNEEPKPQKKKRKKPTKKPAKPKTVIVHNFYDQNVNKALAALKTAVNKNKPSKSGETVKTVQAQVSKTNQKPAQKTNNEIKTSVNKTNPNDDTNPNSEANYASIRIEDIAADIEPSMDHDINYSPVNSPRPESPAMNAQNSIPQPINKNDPLNLQEDYSFFDEQPVASSSMNMSTRHPLASPWRVEFGNLPIKWPVNTYVKPNMTPAVETSFINSSAKKHVYTNMVAESNDVLPEIVDNTPNLKQTSIISFIKEVVERSASKKKRAVSVTPTKANSLFEDLTNSRNATPVKATDKNDNEKIENTSNNDIANKDNSNELRRVTRKRKNDEPISNNPAKSPFKKKDGDRTYFGFDDSENQDQENVSPSKINNPKVRGLRPRARAVLQEINAQSGPTRAILPARSKVASSDAVNKVYEELKSAADAPMFPEKETRSTTVVDDMSMNDDDSQSVHLFEDIEFTHHLKPSRKSYGKAAKKVTFRQRSTSDSESVSNNLPGDDSSYEDDLGDLTFEVNIKEKKTKKKKSKKLMTKKEEQEAEAWAANFNSMCEDIEAFPLVIE